LKSLHYGLAYHIHKHLGQFSEARQLATRAEHYGVKAPWVEVAVEERELLEKWFLTPPSNMDEVTTMNNAALTQHVGRIEKSEREAAESSLQRQADIDAKRPEALKWHDGIRAFKDDDIAWDAPTTSVTAGVLLHQDSVVASASQSSGATPALNQSDLSWRDLEAATLITFVKGSNGWLRHEAPNRMIRFKKFAFAADSNHASFYFQDTVCHHRLYMWH
jgi:hypothetical protein